MICENCGKELPEETSVCPDCNPAINDPDDEIVETEGFEEVQEPDMAEPVEENESEEPETEEYSEEELELIDEEDFEVDLYSDNSSKKSKIVKITAIIVAAILVIVAGMAVFYGYIRPDIDSPIASLFDDGKTVKPVVYTKNVNGTYGLYIGETQLVDFGNKPESFEPYENFVCGEDNMYYIVNGELFWYNIGGKAPVKVADKVNTASVVMSANEKRILFTVTSDSQTILYSYIKGKSPKMEETLPCAMNSYGIPNYGFIGDTSEFWYVMAKDESVNGDVYATSFLSKPKLKLSGVSSVIYYSSDYDAVLYTTFTDTSTAFYIKRGNEPALSLKSDFNGAFEPIIIKAPKEGVAYIGDDGGANDTLYFLPFKGEQRIIDTGVLAAVSVWDSTSSTNQYYEYSAFVKRTDALYYMKDMKVFISRGGNPGQAPTDFSFYSSYPAFSDDTNTIAYLANDTALMVSSYDGSSWSTAVKVADSVSEYVMSSTGKYLAYSVPNETGMTTVNLYNIATAQNQELTKNGIGTILFDLNNPDTLIFASDFNQQAQTATLNYYKDGGAVTAINSVAGLTKAPSGKAIIIQMNAADSNLMDLYTLGKKYTFEPIATAASDVNSY